MKPLRPSCPKCDDIGVIFNPARGRRHLPSVDLCDCMKKFCDSCPGDKNPPYYYYDEEKKELLPCPCRKARLRLEKTIKILENSNIPYKYRYRRLHEFSTDSDNAEERKSLLIALDTAIQTIAQFSEVDREKRGLYLYGPTGTGKTFLACLILNELALQYLIPVRYMKITRDFFNRLRSSFSGTSAEFGKTEEIFQELANIDVLLIDDFGVNQDTSWEQLTLYDLIDTRYENEKTTLITSNISIEDLKEQIKSSSTIPPRPETVGIYQRILSRLNEMMDFVNIITRDYRERLHR